MALRKGGGNWVDGDRFFDRSIELSILEERAHNRVHSLIAAPRRMGKTSLIRESLRQLQGSGKFDTIFVDLEDVHEPSDAIANIAARSRDVQGAWNRIKDSFSVGTQRTIDRLEEVEFSELRVQIRANVTSGDFRQRGTGIFAALASNPKPVVVALDELPIFLNRLANQDEGQSDVDGRFSADLFLSWLRGSAQEYRDNVVLILSGSIGLQPVLRRLGMSAHANIYTPLELKAWDDETALNCLFELAENYEISLPLNVAREMCERLRQNIPHHVQKFFDALHEHLRRERRNEANPADVATVYATQMLSINGQIDLDHYQIRLRDVFDNLEYRICMELLTEAANNSGSLTNDTIGVFHDYTSTLSGREGSEDHETIRYILEILESDGYFFKVPNGYRFVSGLVEDWWRERFCHNYLPIQQRAGQDRRKS